MERRYIIGTRGSDLALWQARFLQAKLSEIDVESELKIIRTQGDRITHLSLEKLEGKGFFTKEIEDALLGGEIDIAVHSHKDLPTDTTPGLIIAAVSGRENPSELLLIRKECVDPLQVFNLKQNAVIGTSSSRRKSQLLFFRPDLQVEDIRGNVPTRIQKLRDGQFDAILIALAGVERLRLDYSDLDHVIISPRLIVPAPAQGVLAYQCREDDADTAALLGRLNNNHVANQIYIEREVMRLFKGGCHMPIGVYCEQQENKYNVWVMKSDRGDEQIRRMYIRGEDKSLLAATIFHQLSNRQDRSILFTTSPNDIGSAKYILDRAGFRVSSQSMIQMRPIPSELPERFDWLFFTSKNGVRHFTHELSHINNLRIGAIGEETSNELKKHKLYPDFTGDGDPQSTAVEFLKIAAGKSVVIPQALNASNTFSSLIQQAVDLRLLPVYVNEPLAATHIKYHDILVFTSALNADAYCKSNKIADEQIVIAIGASTKKHLQHLGVQTVLTPPVPSFLSIADLICGLHFS